MILICSTQGHISVNISEPSCFNTASDDMASIRGPMSGSQNKGAKVMVPGGCKEG